MILDFHRVRVTDLKYNRQGDRLFVASHDDNVSQWDTSTGVLINKFIHPKRVNSISITQDSIVTPLFTLPIIEYDLYGCVTWSPSNKYILANVGSRVDIFDVDTRELVHSIHVIGSILNGKISWTSDQSMFVIGSNCTTILYENNTWRLIRSFDIGRRINDATISSTTPPDPHQIVVIHEETNKVIYNSISNYSTSTTQQVAEINGHDDPSYSISFSPENKSNIDYTT
ncbi:hypothetical protein DFA_10630 [Cavenderia fasciculata]|uniref:Serine-threonine kinase receptor-associated protein n=1 Tax=Cavenderia fasciculata TaxID=261658 RepID=F4QAT4_CACFS|nr:uncharacterized protein DFA_10630 [Cavenderia fasciculata]EGG15787.1 hypothetical protein DFA_10630 [Cavenderia fasciculata]|eukprot:XP_004354534.1 hypothetical protein DFA_10630 [Cavenderia fasciculata]